MSWTGDRLRKLREDLELTQPEMARLLGASRPTIARAEGGAEVPWRMYPWLDELERWAELRESSGPPRWLSQGVPWAWYTILRHLAEAREEEA